MKNSPLIPWLLALCIGSLLSLSYLLDGPSDIDAIQATADSVIDAQISATAAHAIHLASEQP